MNNPDSIDRLNNYMPPDRVKRLLKSDKDKRQKFSRTLKEEQEKEEQPDSSTPRQDRLELGEDTPAAEHAPEIGTDERKRKSAKPSEGEETTEDLAEDKHIDLKA